jgi:hypothetical protein
MEGRASFRQDFLANSSTSLTAAVMEDRGMSDAGMYDASLSGDATTGRKSGLLAVAASLVLPGAGEWYAGRFDRGQYPLIAEGILWLGFAGFRTYGAWIQNDARLFAGQRAGVSAAGKEDQYFGDIGNYNSLTDYNAQKLIDRNLGALYPEDASAGYGWKWSSAAERQSYKDQRISSDEMVNASNLVVLGLVANRVWSAVQAAFLVRKHNASLAPAQSALPTMQSRLPTHNGRTDGIVFTFTGSF